jgi:hypothetical protein
MTARTSRYLLLALLLAPALAGAQMGGGMPMGAASRTGRPGEMDADEGAFAGSRRSLPVFPKTKEIEAYNAAAMLLEKSTKLALSPAEVAALTVVRDSLFTLNADILARYDAIRREYTPPKQPNVGDDPSAKQLTQEQITLLRTQMRQMARIGAELVSRRAADEAMCLAAVGPAAQGDAKKLLEKQTKELRKLLPALEPTKPDKDR